MSDLFVVYSPSVSVIHAETDTAQDWLDNHLDPDAPRMGDGYAVENRYMLPILSALEAEGFRVTIVRGQ